MGYNGLFSLASFDTSFPHGISTRPNRLNSFGGKIVAQQKQRLRWTIIKIFRSSFALLPSARTHNNKKLIAVKKLRRPCFSFPELTMYTVLRALSGPCWLARARTHTRTRKNGQQRHKQRHTIFLCRSILCFYCDCAATMIVSIIWPSSHTHFLGDGILSGFVWLSLSLSLAARTLRHR